MSRPDETELRRARLRLDHVESALRLSREAGWNQAAADWRLMIDAGHALGVWDSGQLIASALTLPFGGPFAWISMVLVTADYRHRGIATSLLHECLGQAARLDKIAGLDATPAGREVYLPLGFRPVYNLSRRWAKSPPRVEPLRRSEIVTRRIQPGDLGRVSAYDQDVFGADRGFILQHLLDRVPERAFLAQRGEDVVGFALARDGRDAHQLGPVVADDWKIAERLVVHALADVRRPVYVDVPDPQTKFSGWLSDLGFDTQRPYTRMLIDRAEPYDEPARVFAIAGPELG
jgi:GNAT superfamily N-acetyltransferase